MLCSLNGLIAVVDRTVVSFLMFTRVVSLPGGDATGNAERVPIAEGALADETRCAV